VKPGIERVKYYSQPRRDLSAKPTSAAPKARKVPQSSRCVRKEQGGDPVIGVVVLLLCIVAALVIVAVTR